MTAMKSDSMVCMVCRKQLAHSEDYLVRLRNGRATTVHRHLCYPPAQQPPARPANQTAA
jgi:hypothetical protein